MRDYVDTGFGISIAGLSALLGGAMVSLESYAAAAAMLVPLVAGLLMLGKAANPSIVDERPAVRAIDAGGIVLAFTSGLLAAQLLGWPVAAAALWGTLAASSFIAWDRVLARRRTGSWTGTREEVTG